MLQRKNEFDGSEIGLFLFVFYLSALPLSSHPNNQSHY